MNSMDGTLEKFNARIFAYFRLIKIYKMKIIIFTFLTLVTVPSFSQNYVITNKGDSLYGKVKFLSYDLLDRVQVNNEKKVILTAVQVKVVALDGDLYKAARLGNAIRFMKVIKAGYLSLYAFKPENQTGYEGRMLIKTDGHYIEAPNLAFKRVLIEFLEDCEAVTSRIKSGELGRRELELIIDSYNACIKEKDFTVSKEAIAITEPSKKKIEALQALRKRTIASKDPQAKDASDLIDDITTKVKKGDAVPKYQIDALKSYLSILPDLKTELDQVLSLLAQ
jgi:hypothetical protein